MEPPRRYTNRRRSAVRRVVQPIQEFINTEVFSGAVLLTAAVVAIVWANSPFKDQYADLFGTRITIDAALFRIDEDLRHWINDALMAFFFFVVGLEIKREFLRGELRGLQSAALPAIAAFGGMAGPALIYTAFNAGGAGGDGWGIPMATDIAFALGILALLGRRIPTQLRVFLLALAIVDDIGAILVIAVFYSGDIQVDSLALAGGLLALIYAMYRLGIQNIPAYFVVGAFVWLAVFESGIHATIAGVVLGLMTPLDPVKVTIGDRLRAVLQRVTTRVRVSEAASAELANEQELGPLYRLEHGLHPLTSFLIVPLFALANAGVSLEPDAVSDAVGTPVTWGVAVGLLCGKPIGIVLFAWLTVRMGISPLPKDVTWAQVLGVGVLAGVGFTVALFVNELAFDSGVLIERGKIGILAGSLAAGIGGYLMLRSVTASRPESDTHLR
jgi:NhaA family Na+:H+ antiporter